MTDALVILVPGTEGASQDSFAGLQPLLARDYDVRLFDFHSAGATPQARLDGYVDQLLKIIGEAGERRIHLLGYSLGAHIALRAAAESATVTSLCLVGGWLKTDSFQRERHELWLRLYDEQPELAGRLSLLLQFSPTYRQFLAQQQTATALVPGIPNEEIRQRVTVNNILDSTDAARRVDVPTLIISGTADMKVPTGQAMELYGAIKGATVVQTNSGHAILRERLGEVYGSYDDFLQGVMSPGQAVSTLVP